MAKNVRSVPIGEIIASDAPNDVLVAYGLGSCVAVCLYDPVAQVGGLLHALLPTSTGNVFSDNGRKPTPARFVDQGTPMLIESLVELGAQRSRMIARLCGGARVLSALDIVDFLNIGERNVQAAENTLRAEGIPVQAQATGGGIGRTVRLYMADGQVTVKSLARGEQVLQ
ncbi:MAG: chemotaxis protein CheD [Anaerolineae bacterium]